MFRHVAFLFSRPLPVQLLLQPIRQTSKQLIRCPRPIVFFFLSFPQPVPSLSLSSEYICAMQLLCTQSEREREADEYGQLESRRPGLLRKKKIEKKRGRCCFSSGDMIRRRPATLFYISTQSPIKLNGIHFPLSFLGPTLDRHGPRGCCRLLLIPFYIFFSSSACALASAEGFHFKCVTSSPPDEDIDDIKVCLWRTSKDHLSFILFDLTAAN